METQAMRNQDLRLLELESDATYPQIEEAYRRLMRRYSVGGLASYGLLRVEERRRFLFALQESFERLRDSAHQTFVNEERAPQPSFPDLTPFPLPSEGPVAELGREHELPFERTQEPSMVSDASLGELPPVPHDVEPTKAQQDQMPLSLQGTVRKAAFSSVRRQHAAQDTRRQGSSPSGLSLVSDGVGAGAYGPQASVSSASPSHTTSQVGAIGVGEQELSWQGPFSGARLRQARERQQLSLSDLSERYGVSQELLGALEEENYEQLGSSRQIRKLLTVYARTMGLAQKQLLIDYLAAYWGWRTRQGGRRG